MTKVSTRLGILCLSVALTATACTDAGTHDRDGDTTPEPAWITIEVSDTALPDEPYGDVSGALSRSGDLPAIMFGTITAPDGPARAKIWYPDDDGLGDSVELDIDATESYAESATHVGDTTWLVGSAWDDGRVESVLMNSSDRRTWTSVDVPDELADDDIDLKTVVDAGDGRAIAIGSSDEEVIALDIRSGRTTTLPDPGNGLSEFDATAIVDAAGRVVVLVAARSRTATWMTVPLLSTDGARTWHAGNPLPGSNVMVDGAVWTPTGPVATGEKSIGTDDRPGAWSSRDGLAWRAERIPYAGRTGWPASLSAPASVDGAVHAAVADTRMLAATVLRRDPQGRWRRVAQLEGGWRYPGASMVLAADGPTLRTARSQDGRIQVGHWDGPGRGFVASGPPSSVTPVSWWDSARVDGDRINLVGARTEMEVEDDGGWQRHTRLTPYVVEDTQLATSAWDPPGLDDLADLEAAAAPDDSQVIIGEEMYDDRAGGLQSRLVGWHKTTRGDWAPITNLPGPRSELSRSLRFHADVEGSSGVWVLTGVDAADLSGGHRFGAIWTSADGVAWRREKGPFDVDGGLDSWLVDSCRLPGGDLLAVGARQDAAAGSRPLAFRRTGTAWRAVDLAGLGDGVTDLTSCTTTGTVTVLEGWNHSAALWRTSDGVSFEPFEIGKDADHSGRVVAVDGGFAAPGHLFDGGASRPVVWLSADGERWRDVPVPADRVMSVDQVLAWEDRLVITLTGVGGPGVQILENLPDLLDGG